MENQKYNCEHHCSASTTPGATELIVLTGGPGAGKTAVLEFIRKILCEHVAILPEAASILFGGGFWRLDSNNSRIAAQKAIFHVQEEMQNLVKSEGRWSLGLCDRGTLDGLAYWPGSAEQFFSSFNTSIDNEYSKYKAVIHLRSPSLDNGYNHQNPVRIETAEDAAYIDNKIHHIWKSHPHYIVIDSTADFYEKILKATEHLKSLVPDCCQQHFEKIK